MMEGKVNNKFSNLPAGWEVKKLKDVFYINELALPANTPSDFQFRYIPIEKVSTNHIDFENCEQFEFQDAPGRARRIIRQNDILISGVRPNLKAFAIFKKPDDKNWICSTGFFVLTAKQPEDNLISYYELLSEICGSQFYSLVVGTNYPAIGDSDIRNIRLILPSSKEEKTAVANILSKVDKAIASVQNSIAAAERLKKSLMQNLLTGKMKPDGTFRTPEEFYIDEKFGKVPVGWHWGRLSEIADIIAGQSPQGEYYNVNGAGKPMLNGPTEFTDKYPVPVQWTTKITKLCKKGDILFTVRGSSTGRMNLADQEYCIGRGLAAIRPKSNNNISFIYYALLKISEMILAEAKGAGTTFPNVSRGELMKKAILIPDTRQNEIIAPIEQLARFSDSKQRSIDKLEILKKSLMQNLLTGKIKIQK